MQIIKRLLSLVLLTAAAYFLIHTLYKKSSDTELLKKNGFTRFFIGGLKEQQAINLNDKTNKLISVEDTILSILNESSKEVTQLSIGGIFLRKINISTFETCKPDRFHNVSISNQMITGFDSRSKLISTKNLSIPTDSGSCLIIKNSLIRGIRIANTSILRVLDTGNKYAVFIKVNMQKNEISQEQNISEKVLDGGLANDGIFIPVDSTKVIFMYYHKNIYKCLDTNLNLIFTHYTVDTSKNAPKIKALPMGGYAFSEPVKVKNMRGCADNNIVYVNSSLISENENKKEFRNNSVIDKYDLLTGKYLGSFYIPTLNGERINDFKVKGNKLFALHEKALKIYNIYYPNL